MSIIGREAACLTATTSGQVHSSLFQQALVEQATVALAVSALYLLLANKRTPNTAVKRDALKRTPYLERWASRQGGNRQWR